MSRFVQLSTCSAFALTTAMTPAFADLSAQEVWDGMESAMQGFGYTVNATETPSSGGLNVNDVALSITMPENNGQISFSIESLELVENGDGSVSMTFPASMPIAISAAPAGGDDVSMVLNYSNTDLVMTVSGDPSEMTYTYSADELMVDLSELIVEGETMGRDVARFSFAMNGLSGSATTNSTDGTKISQDVNADTASYDMAFNDPDGDEAALVSGSLNALAFTSSTELPEGFDPSDPKSLTNGGFSGLGSVRIGGSEMQFAATEHAGTTNGETSSGSIEVDFEMNGSLLSYGVKATDQNVGLSGPNLPIPISFSMSESAFEIVAPIAESDTPKDMAFGLKLGGFEMSDLIWNIFDPGAALPRDPATIALDLTGQVTPFLNLFDPAEMAGLETSGAAPGELNSLTLNDLTIEAAGAKLGGSGAFTFDNSDLQTFGGFPRPSGGVDLSLEGANGLIDKLIAMGILSNEDAMGARMAMSMFAVPGDGPDNLNSSIKINDQGHVLANGMRIQ